MTLALVNAAVVIDRELVMDRAVLIDGDRISAIVPTADVPATAERHDLGGLTLAPGFIDVQVNGGGGVLFNDAPTVETIARIGAAHRAFGTTGFLPTLISDDLAVVRAGVAAVDEAIAAGVPGVLGIHIEGPFLNTERKGIHDPSRMRLLDEIGFDAITGLTRGRTLVTIAPELTTAAMIAKLADAGVIIAAGHTNATFAQIEAAAGSGMTGLTHLYNAMSPLASREPGAVGAGLTDDRLWCSIIVDGQHLHPAAARLLDHAGKPPFGGAMDDWRRAIARLSALPNVACKLSGLATELPEHAPLTELDPCIDPLIDRFAPDRLIWGSDWPVVTLAATPGAWLDRCRDRIATNAPHAADAIFGDNARRIYRLSAAPGTIKEHI